MIRRGDRGPQRTEEVAVGHERKVVGHYVGVGIDVGTTVAASGVR